MIKKDLHVVSFSGGKDSTAMLLRLLESGMPVDMILFNDTGLEVEQLYDHINRVEQYITKYTDVGITRVLPEQPFEFYFFDVPIHHRKKTKFNERLGTEDVSFSLTSCDRHAVAYGIDRAAFNQGQNALYNIAVEEEIEPTIVAKGPGAVAQPTYCTSKNSYHTKANIELAGTLVESDYKDPPVVNDTNRIEYIVRRLTPSECAVLQGYDRDWCSNLGTENPTSEDIEYWRNVFDEYNHAIGKSVKPKSDNQIIKWLRDPHSDSAEYSLWGNGLCKWCAVFVLSGIAYFDAHEEEIE